MLALVITLACAALFMAGRLVRSAAPFVAIFYLAAMIERALNYRPSSAINSPT